ncbi:MAG: hypothetical protein JNL97_01330, partial [Verrucomicrobiales bacterium]|nr:hypothetical protein [Verrucomicrobiales bacterium]
KFAVTAEASRWPGLALLTTKTYTAGATTPTTFEIDRVKVEFDLVTGTGAEQRTGIWVKNAAGNYVFFADYLAHDGRNFGWGYNKSVGAADDNATGNAVNIIAFDGGKFDDRAKHRAKIVVNGATAKLYLDDVFGAEVPFPFGTGLTFGFGTYVDETGNVARGHWDNARVLGGEDTSLPPAPIVFQYSRQGQNLNISWTGAGTLQESDSVGATAFWRPVTPPPAGTSHTVAIGSGSAPKYYRVVR